MDHSSKCKPFTGQCGLEHNKVIKCDVVEVGLKGEKGFVVRVSYGPSRSSKIQWWISMYFEFFPSFSSWHEEGNAFCFLKDVQFSRLKSSNESSGHQTEDLKVFGSSYGSLQSLPHGSEGREPRGRKTNLWGKKKRYLNNVSKRSCYHVSYSYMFQLLQIYWTLLLFKKRHNYITKVNWFCHWTNCNP